jgi:endonuclease/exonuclease/phosphatase family metal-dependent hydrolase
MRIFLLMLVTLAASCGGVEDPFSGLGTAVGADTRTDLVEDAVRLDRLGPACTEASQCESAECAVIGAQSVCIARCAEASDCVPGWLCAPYPELNATVCECSGLPEDEEVGNGEDDDCDGQVDEGLPRLAFWNVRDLSLASRDDTELSLIADVIEDYALVAIAEISDDSVLAELEEILDRRGDAWAIELSERIGDSSGSAEHYGFIWREQHVSLVESRALDEVLTEDGERFDREPFLGVFELRATGWRFALVNVHVTWGAGEEARIGEVRALLQYYEPLAEEFQDVIIAGDLNRNAGDEEGIGWLLERTGLVDTTSRSPATKVNSNNTYDHILLDPERTTEYPGTHGVDQFDRELFPDDENGALTAMSDHRPVWITLSAR